MSKEKRNHAFNTPRNYTTYQAYAFTDRLETNEDNKGIKKKLQRKTAAKRICRHFISGKCEVNNKYCSLPNKMFKCKWFY